MAAVNFTCYAFVLRTHKLYPPNNSSPRHPNINKMDGIPSSIMLSTLPKAKPSIKKTLEVRAALKYRDLNSPNNHSTAKAKYKPITAYNKLLSSKVSG